MQRLVVVPHFLLRWVVQSGNARACETLSRRPFAFNSRFLHVSTVVLSQTKAKQVARVKEDEDDDVELRVELHSEEYSKELNDKKKAADDARKQEEKLLRKQQNKERELKKKEQRREMIIRSKNVAKLAHEKQIRSQSKHSRRSNERDEDDVFEGEEITASYGGKFNASDDDYLKDIPQKKTK